MVAVRDACTADAAAIASIYNHYVRETIITFEEEPIDADEIARRIVAVLDAKRPYLVAEEDESILGYAYAGSWRARPAYRSTFETAIYLAPTAHGRGIGSTLYGALLAALPGCGCHVAIGGISLPNAASVALHEKLGFKKVAHHEQVGRKFGTWVDVGFWQRFV